MFSSGGPGPEIAISLEDFPPGEVILRITVSTRGGQSENSTVTLTVTRGDKGARKELVDYNFVITRIELLREYRSNCHYSQL